MISFPHCKINLGLDVLRKRPDGYHDIETVMFPVRDLCDSLEIIVPEEEKEATELTESGLRTGCPPQENIVMKAWRLMHETYGIGNVRMHLHKAVPSGAGLGGESADGAAALRMLDTLFSVGAGIRRLEALALKLGSDVPFFLHDAPQLCSGRGEVMRPAEIDLKGYWMVLVKPAICIPTAEAYAGITPRIPEEPLAKRLSRPIATWRDNLPNAFETSLFRKHPELSAIKRSLYDAGALYASMSGSGSAIFGLFDTRPEYETGTGIWHLQL